MLSLGEAIRLAAVSPRCALNRAHDSIVGLKDIPFPRRIFLHLANRCNFACPMCSIGVARAERQKQFAGDMPFEIVQKAIEEASKYGSYFELLGGEPSLYSKLSETIKMLSKHRLLSYITTNGLNLRKRAAEIVEGGLKVLTVSMDGWDEESSYKRGQVPGSFEAIQKGIAEVHRLRGKRFFPIIRISSVITKANFHSFDRIAEAVYDMGVRRWNIQNYYFMTDAAAAAHRVFKERTGMGAQIMQQHIPGGGAYFTHEQVATLRQSMARLQDKLQGSLKDLRVDFAWDLDLDRYYSEQLPSLSSTCEMSFNRVDIYPDGHIAACGDGYTLGNIRNQTIESAWNGPQMRQFRDILNQHKIMPMCFRCCGIMSGLKFDESYSAESQLVETITA